MLEIVLESRLHGTTEARMGSKAFFSEARDSILSIYTQRSPSLIVPDIIDHDYNPLSNIQRSPSFIIPDCLSSSSIEHSSSILVDVNTDIKKDLKFEDIIDAIGLQGGDKNDMDLKYNNEGKYNLILAETLNTRISYNL